MPLTPRESGLAQVNGAELYYEVAGTGPPFVMIHAGIADSRQWNNEFDYYAPAFRVIRYDMRGYGKSEPVAGEYSHLRDLTALLAYLHVDQPLIVMGCSMGGGLALDFALAEPVRAKALILVGSGPTGLELDVPKSEHYTELEQAYEADDLDRAAELETQIFFDGTGRKPAQVNQAKRALAYEMNRTALAHEAKALGKRLPDSETPAFARLDTLDAPTLLIVGEHDVPYCHAAADIMVAKMPAARKTIMSDAAHLANMDHPDTFRSLVSAFVNELSS